MALRPCFSCIRLDEIAVLQGTPLLGAAFALGGITPRSFAVLALFAAASCCLVAHSYALNDWAGFGADRRDPNRAPGAPAGGSLGRRAIGWLALALLALGLALFALLGVRALAFALAIAGLSALYSLPAFHLKGVPVLSSVLHLAGGVLHFLLGWSLFRAIDGRALAIGAFFALTFAAGHLTQEVRDHEGDSLNGIRTNAVTFGKARSFAAGLAFFTVADVLLVVLAVRGDVPHALVLVAVLYPLHLHWSLGTLREGLTFATVRRLQARYRGLYALLGTAMAACLLLHL